MESIPQEAHGLIYGNRHEAYGSYTNECAKIIRAFNALSGLELEPRHLPLMMICMKIARQTHKHKRDNLVDLCGYAGLWGDMEGEPDFSFSDGGRI